MRDSARSHGKLPTAAEVQLSRASRWRAPDPHHEARLHFVGNVPHQTHFRRSVATATLRDSANDGC